MFKIIELGYEVHDTGESRVSLLDDGLLKLASNDIREEWHTMEREPGRAYLHVIAMTDSEKYGCNRNGDYFLGKDLKNWYQTFVTDAHVFLHHINKDPKKSIGKPVFAYYNDIMHRVELILEIDKNNNRARDVIDKIKNGDQIYVSMGVKVDSDVCSVCDNTANNKSQYCKCLKYNMRKILPSGKQVYAINNPPFKFFDMSIVRKPADPVAWALEKAASKKPDSEEFDMLSADLGDLQKLAEASLEGLQKLSEAIKQIDGDIVSVKDEDGETDTLPKRKDLNIKHLYYPQLSNEEFEDLELSPGGLLSSFLASGVTPSLGECAHISHRFVTGTSASDQDITNIFEALPGAVKLLQEKPLSVPNIIQELMSTTDNDNLESPALIIKITKVMEPVKKARIILIKQAGTVGDLEKESSRASTILPQLSALESQPDFGGWRQLLESADERGPWGPAMHGNYTVQGPGGEELVTSRRSVNAAQEAKAAARVLKNAAGGALGVAAIGALLSNRRLLVNLLKAIPVGLLAAAIYDARSGGDERVTTQENVEIPVTTIFHEKKASRGAWLKTLSSGGKAAIPYTNQELATAAGMAVPGLLGLDYLVNKHLRYKGHPAPEMEMGKINKLLYTLGKASVEHPFLSIGVGGILGGMPLRMLAKK